MSFRIQRILSSLQLRKSTTDDQEINVGHANYFKSKELYIAQNERLQAIHRIPPAMRQKVREAHRAGPVPPQVEAMRNQRDNALRYVAEFVEDPICTIEQP
eukprot:3963490-Pyramimonas_sp.AAC.1